MLGDIRHAMPYGLSNKTIAKGLQMAIDKCHVTVEVTMNRDKRVARGERFRIGDDFTLVVDVVQDHEDKGFVHCYTCLCHLELDLTNPKEIFEDDTIG